MVGVERREGREEGGGGGEFGGWCWDYWDLHKDVVYYISMNGDSIVRWT